MIGSTFEPAPGFTAQTVSGLSDDVMNIFDRAKQRQMQQEAFNMQKQKFAGEIASTNLGIQQQEIALKKAQMGLAVSEKQAEAESTLLDIQKQNRVAAEKGLSQIGPDAESLRQQLNNDSLTPDDKLALHDQFMKWYAPIMNDPTVAPRLPNSVKWLQDTAKTVADSYHMDTAKGISRLTAVAASPTSTPEQMNAVTQSPYFRHAIMDPSFQKFWAEGQKRISDIAETQLKGQQDIKKVEAESTVKAKDELEKAQRQLGISGFEGLAPTESEATKFRESQANVLSATNGVKQLLEIAETPGATTNPDTRKRAQVIASMLQGSLRTELVGPGAVSESERHLIDSVIANPTSIFSLSSQNKTALNTLADRLQSNLNDKAAVMGLKPSKSGGSQTLNTDANSGYKLIGESNGKKIYQDPKTGQYFREQ